MADRECNTCAWHKPGSRYICAEPEYVALQGWVSTCRIDYEKWIPRTDSLVVNNEPIKNLVPNTNVLVPSDDRPLVEVLRG